MNYHARCRSTHPRRAGPRAGRARVTETEMTIRTVASLADASPSKPPWSSHIWLILESSVDAKRALRRLYA